MERNNWEQKYAELFEDYTRLCNEYNKLIIENMKEPPKTQLDNWFYELDVNELEGVAEIDINSYTGDNWEYSYIAACNNWWKGISEKEKQTIFDNYTKIK